EGADQAAAGRGELGEAALGGGAVAAFARRQVLRLIDAGDLDADGMEPGLVEQLAIRRLLERARAAARPELHVLAQFNWQMPLDDDVRDREAATGLEHTEGLAQHARLVTAQVDHAVGNDNVHAVVGERNLFDVALEEPYVLNA